MTIEMLIRRAVSDLIRDGYGSMDCEKTIEEVDYLIATLTDFSKLSSKELVDILVNYKPS